MRLAAIVIICGLLGGCASNGPSLAESDDLDCRAYGAQPGSPAYFQCRLAKDQQRQQLRAAVIGAYISNH